MEESMKKQLLSLSFVKELQGKILELEEKVEKFQAGIVQKCWLDGSVCPYGNPEGQFMLRPSHFCNHESCPKVFGVSDDLLEIVGGDGDGSELLAGLLPKDKETTLSKALSAVLEDVGKELDDDEKVCIKTVAEILENGTDDYNPRIYRTVNLEEVE